MGVPAKVQQGKLLDVGCSNGQQILIFKELGWELYGVELSEDAAAIARSSGITTYTGTFDEVELDMPAYFDTIRMWHSLEHLPDVRAGLTKVNYLLRPGGTLILGLPNIASINSKIFRSKWSALEVPRHLSHFSPKTITKLLEQQGFEVQSIRFNSDEIFTFSSEYVYNGLIRRFFGKSTYGHKYANKTLAVIFSLGLDWFLSHLYFNDLMEVVAVKKSSNASPNS
jgi:2-polyprenyl-3-methyl-5-hydroxy-6-metoxy-1,4-benzoquinol methylase